MKHDTINTHTHPKCLGYPRCQALDSYFGLFRAKRPLLQDAASDFWDSGTFRKLEPPPIVVGCLSGSGLG